MKRAAIVVALGACGSGSNYAQMQMPAPAPAAPPVALTAIALATADNATAMCPWSNPPLQIVVTGTTNDGRRVATGTDYRQGAVWHEEHGLPAARFRVTANVGRLTPIDIYVPPQNMLDLAELPAIEFQVQDLAQGLTAQLSVPIDFRCNQATAFRGRTGGGGANGSSGYPGEPGGSVQISLARLQSRAHGALTLARLDGPSGRSYYVLGSGATLTVDLTGGDGGRGGTGLRAQAAIGDTGISYEGPPGPGGQGGPGGAALVRVDRNDRMLANAVRIRNPGGNGGPPGENRRGIGAFEHVTNQSASGPPGYAGPPSQVSYEDATTLFADEIAQGMPIARPAVATRR